MKKIFLYALLLFGGLIVGGYLFLTLPPGEAVLRRLVERQLTNALGAPVHIEALHTNLLSVAELAGIQIRSETAPDTGRVAYIRSLHVRYRLGFRTIAVRDVAIHDVSLDLIRGQTGFNLAIIDSLLQRPAQPPDTTGWAIEIQSVSIERADVHYLDRVFDAEVSARLPATRIHRRSQPNGHALTLSAADVQLRRGDASAPLAAVELEGFLDDTGLNIAPLRLRDEPTGFSLNMTGTVDRAGPLNLDLHFSTESNEKMVLQVLPLLNQPVPEEVISLAASARGRITGRPDQPVVTGDLSLGQTRYADLQIDSLTTNCVYDTTGLRLSEAIALAYGGVIHFSSTLVLKPEPILSGVAHIRRLSLRSLRAALAKDAPAITGAVRGRVEVEIPLNAPLNSHVDARLNLAALQVGKFFPKNTLVTGTVEQGRLNARVSYPGIVATLSGDLSPEHIFGGAFELNPVGELPTEIHMFRHDLAARITATGHVQVFPPDVQAHVFLTRASVKTLRVDSLSAFVAYQDDSVHIDSTRFWGSITNLKPILSAYSVEGTGGPVQFEGDYCGVWPRGAGHLEISGRAATLSSFKADTIYLSLTADDNRLRTSRFRIARGDTVLDLNLSTTLVRPFSWRGSASLHGPAHSDAPPELTTPAGVVELEGALDDTLRLEVQVRDMSIPHALAFLADSPPLGGVLKAGASLHGHPAAPYGVINLQVSKPSVPAAQVDSAWVQLVLDGVDLWIDNAGLLAADHRIDATGRVVNVAARGDQPRQIDLYAGIPPLQLSAVKWRVPGWEWDGLLEGGFHLEGPMLGPSLSGFMQVTGGHVEGATGIEVSNLASLASIRGTLDNPSMKMNMQAGPFRVRDVIADSFQARLRFEREMIHLDALRLKLGENYSTASGYAPLRLNADTSTSFIQRISPLSLEADARDLDLGFLAPLSPNIKRMGGNLNYNLKVTADTSGLSTSGMLSLSHGFIELVDISPTVTGLWAQAKLEDNVLSLERLEGNLPPGRFWATGRGSFGPAGLDSMWLGFGAERVAINMTDLFSMNVQTADVTFHTTDPLNLLEGNVVLGETRYIADFDPVFEILRPTVESTLPWPMNTQWAQNTRMNVQVTASEKLWVDMNLARIQSRASLTLVGWLGRPNIAGQVTTIEGYLIYLDRVFKIDEGFVYFSDPNQINPDLDIVARSRIRGYQNENNVEYEVTLTIGGNMEQPSVELESEPAEAPADIIALMTVGRTRASLMSSAPGQNGDSIDRVLLERAREITNHKISGIARQRLGTALNLDDVAIEGDLLRLDQSWGPRVTMTKRLADRLNLTYSTVVGHATEQWFKLSYRLADHFFLEGESAQEGRAGLDLKYILKFK